MGKANPFVSNLPYHTERMHAAAVYCSDGRVCEQYDDFLRNGLNLPRYDRVALPGGPASLAGYSQASIQEAGLLDELNFLVNAHGLEKVVLIQHEDCAFYGVSLGVASGSRERLQKADLVRGAYMVRRVTEADIEVLGFFARRTPKGVVFEQVDVK